MIVRIQALAGSLAVCAFVQFKYIYKNTVKTIVVSTQEGAPKNVIYELGVSMVLFAEEVSHRCTVNER